MAPREKYAIHSLKAHIDKTKANAATTANKPLASRPASNVKKEAAKDEVFTSKDDSDDSTSSSDDDSDEEGSANFLAKLQRKKQNGTPAINKKLSKDDEIADSDVERQSAKKNKQSGGAPVKAESSDDSSSEESDSEDAGAKAGNGTKGGATDSSSTSGTSDSEAESESEDEQEGPIEKAAKQPEEPKAVESDAESDSSSSEESSDDDSEEEEDAQTAKPEAAPMPNGTPANKSSSTKRPEANDSDESSSSSDDEDEQADVSMHIADREDESRVAAPAVIAPDFMIRKSDQGVDGSDVAKVLSQANLEGKQLWYFTTPSNVPVSVVQNLEIRMDAAYNGESVFSHDGEDYGVAFNNGITKSTIQILLPSAQGPEYQPCKCAIRGDARGRRLTVPVNRQVDNALQIKRLPQIGASSSQRAAKPAPPPAARPQPEGLRARYKPIGVYDPAPETAQGSEDVTMTEAPTMTTPSKKDAKATKAAAKAEKKAKKEKSKKGDVIEVQSTPQDSQSQDSFDPATLKRKITASEEDAELAAEQLKGESSAAAREKKKRKTEKAGSPDLGSDLTPSKAATATGPTGTPATAKKDKKPKKEKKSDKSATTPATQNASAESSTAKKQTPVPLPTFPGSSQFGSKDIIPSSQPTPVPKKEKAKKSKQSSSS